MYDEQKEETERKSERVMTREKKETYIGLMGAGGTLKETNEKQTTRSRDTDTNCLVYIYMREKKVSISWLRGRKQKGRRERGRERDKRVSVGDKFVKKGKIVLILRNDEDKKTLRKHVNDEKGQY